MITPVSYLYHHEWRKDLSITSDYPKEWGLTDSETEALYDKACAALGTTNGDTGPVEITARELLLLLRSHVLRI